MDFPFCCPLKEIFIIASCFVCMRCNNRTIFGSQSEAEFLEHLLDPTRYDPRVRPNGEKGGPTIVTIDFHISSISSINEISMDYHITLFLRQKWLDRRLSFDEFNETLTLNYRLSDKLWIPDLFFRNEKDGISHEITVPNRLLTLDPNGTIYYSQRLSMVLACDMNLASYPMDDQTCKIEMETYNYNTRELLFEWRKRDPVQISNFISLPEFLLMEDHTRTDDCSQPYITGTFSCKNASLHFIRQFKYHALQTYAPSVLIVILSWVSFWIDTDAVPARISLGLLTVLTMATWNTGTTATLPRVSYVKAIDVWTTTCMSFVFAALVEFSLVNIFRRKDNKRKTLSDLLHSENVVANITNGLQMKIAKQNGQQLPDQDRPKSPVSPASVKIQPPKEHTVSFREKIKTNRSYLVDVLARILFPLSFGVFNTAYWCLYYLPREEQYRYVH